MVHRITGLLLIVLLATKVISGLFMLPETDPPWALPLHRQAVLDIALIFLLCLHACFGVKTSLFEIGFRREKLLTYGATAVAVILSAAATVAYLWMA